MLQIHKLRRQLTCLVALCLCAGAAFAERVPQVEGVFYYQPATYASGAEVVWNNPAGVGRFNAAGFQLMADYYHETFAKSWGGVMHEHGLAVAYRYLHRPEGNYKEYILNAGVPVSRSGIYFGGSYRYFSEGPGIYNKRHSWNIGLLSQSSRTISWAAVWSNLNRGKIGDQRTEMEQRYSVSYRPINSRFTLSVDMLLSTHMELDNADFIYHLEAVPMPGLFVSGYIDSDKNFEIGVRANLLKYFVGSRMDYNKHGSFRHSTSFIGANNRRQASLIKEPQRRLAVSISGGTPENPARPVIGRSRTSFTELITTIYRASTDPRISEMVINLRGLAYGLGQAEELRNALLNFRSRSKRVICHLGMPNNIGYYVATACDSILIPPVSQLNLIGLRAELTFYAATLEKIGVKVELLRIGEYKTAPERYTRAAASEANREQTNRLLDQLYDQFVTGIAQGRGLTSDSVKNIIDNGPFTSADALRFGLVDGLSYLDQMPKSYLRPMPEISFRRYKDDTLLNDDWGTKPVIAIVVADGEMALSSSGLPPFNNPNVLTPSKMRQAFARVSSDPRVKGIVFRINSPGGDALVSSDIYHWAEEAAKRKPMVVSMSNLAASGGFYIAMSAKRVFADPGTVTGSIGIYGGKLDLQGLYKKLAVGKELYTRGRFAGMMTWTRPSTEEEREKYFSQLEAFYDHFVDLVAVNRGLTADSINNLGQGRVWTGNEAIANGLIDDLGGLQDAIVYTAGHLQLTDYRIKIYPENRPLFLVPRLPLLEFVSAALSGGASPEAAIEHMNLPQDWNLYARLPYDITID